MSDQETSCHADRVRGKATRVGSVLVTRTTERTLWRQGRAFRPKISRQMDRKCRETFPRKPHRQGPSLPVHVIASNDARRLLKIGPECMTPRQLSHRHRVGGSRRASTETVTGRPGQAGLRRRRLKSIWVIPSRLYRTGSDWIRPDQVKPTLNLPKLSLLTATEYLTTVVIRR